MNQSLLLAALANSICPAKRYFVAHDLVAMTPNAIVRDAGSLNKILIEERMTQAHVPHWPRHINLPALGGCENLVNAVYCRKVGLHRLYSAPARFSDSAARCEAGSSAAIGRSYPSLAHRLAVLVRCRSKLR
jgi:hypothetical protein